MYIVISDDMSTNDEILPVELVKTLNIIGNHNAQYLSSAELLM